MIELSDFPADKTYIYLDKKYKIELLNRAIKKAESQSKLAIEFNKNIGDIKITQTTISRWLKCKTLRLDIYLNLCRYLNKRIAYSEIIGLKGLTTSEFIYPNIPILLTRDLANILAKIYCDGCITPKSSYTVTYNNTCPELLSEFKRCIKCVFGDTIIKQYKYNNVSVLRVSGIVGRLLYEKFKLYEHRVPEQILNADKSIKSKYLRAVFDDEGTVNRLHGQIRLKMKYRSFLYDIQNMLRSFDISTSNVVKERYISGCYYFTISGQYNLRKFSKTISFTHHRKSYLLNKRLNSYIQNNYGYNAEKIVLAQLRREPKTAKQLASLLDRSNRVIQYHLKNLKEKNLVEYSKLKKQFSYEFLWRARNDNIDTRREAVCCEAYSISD